MAKFVVNPQRYDPYKNFKFRITIGGRVVAGIHEVTGLYPKPESPKKRSGRKIPGLQKFGNLTLKRGMTQDPEFLDWIKTGSNKGAGDTIASLRKNAILEVCNEQGELIASYRLINGWPMKVEAPDLNSKGNELAIESIELSYEGLELIKS